MVHHLLFPLPANSNNVTGCCSLSLTCSTPVHVTDFGLARTVKAHSYGKTTGGLGAIKWLAPEAISTNRYDERTDAYRQLALPCPH